MRLVEAEFPASYCERVRKYVELADAIHWRIADADAQGRCVLRAVFEMGGAQQLVDAMQGLFETEAKWRIIVLPVEATAPHTGKARAAGDELKRKTVALREEIYHDVSEGAALSADFLLLTALSTIVAAIGLATNNIAVIIGAMVIAPLLGPVVAFAFGAAIGDLDLVMRAGRAALSGLGLGFAFALGVGAVFPFDLSSPELVARTGIGLDAVALALASGAAAALSISAGLPGALVGVMVAVALLPPSAAAGIFLGAGDPASAFRAGLLLTVNVVCVNLAALGVFAYKGIRPRTWVERISAAKATRVNAGVLVFLLAVLVAAILVR